MNELIESLSDLEDVRSFVCEREAVLDVECAERRGGACRALRERRRVKHRINAILLIRKILAEAAA